MTSYIVRRLLLMIPTLFGVTIVSFLVMHMAPGDPLLGHGDAQGLERESSREDYLVQKRALGLDKPVLLNFNDFRDYHEPVRTAAHFLGRSTDEIAKQLPELASAPVDSDAGRRRSFLASLAIPDFAKRLADPATHAALAHSIVDFVMVWCENAGTSAVPAAVASLRDPAADLPSRRGAIRALSHMLTDPFVYGYSREPHDSKTPAVVATWRLWWGRHRDDFQPVSDDRREALQKELARLAKAPSRNALMEGLERFRKSDVPFFAHVLLGDSTLAEKNVAALMLRLSLGKPLATDVPLSADEHEVDRAAENWTTYYDVNRSAYERTLPEKLWRVVADTQYAHMVVRLATFNFGPSALKTREPVGEKIWRAFTVTAPLMLASETLIYLIAVPLGIICAVHRGRLLDRTITFGLFVLYSVPTFVAAMILLLLFCYGEHFQWFPMSGLHSQAADEMGWGAWLLDYGWHAFLPIVCLSLFSLAGLAMYARASMLDVISADYVRTARAKGVPEHTVICSHALRNALIPVITLFADFLPAMLGGSVLVEVLFSIPGMGRLSWSSLEQKDYPTLMALVYIDAIVVLVSILLSDLLYHVVDPRITLEATGEMG
ncbi:MAG TPA: ABC transporter permease subunit [Pirellulales bacterium]|jgi:peptide/nickel transport system permease protein|nr:ABC transporter permease subunit [Pirellulales bacterium]